MKSRFLFALAALSLSGLAAAAAHDVQSVVVRYGDLDLKAPAGIATLHKRIRKAAEAVCGPEEIRLLALRAAHKRCVSEALADGIAAVGNPELARFHESRGNGVVMAANRR